MTYQAIINQAPEGAEILAATIIGFFDTVRQEALDPVLAQYGLSRETIAPDEWVSYQLLLDVSQLATDNGGKDVEIALGKATAVGAAQLYQLNDLHRYFNTQLNEIATSVVRNIPDGFGFVINQLGGRNYHVKSNIPTPDYVIYGMIWEVCRLLVKPGESFILLPGPGFGTGTIPGSLEVKWGKDV